LLDSFAIQFSCAILALSNLTRDIDMKKALILGLALTGTLTVSNSFAGDAEAGKAKSVVCAACHGATGHSVNPLWPNLAGQQEMYLAKQIKAFRDGERKDPSMSPMVAGLTDADIDNLAAYFASQK
jgi:cytochrome c553